MKLLNNILYLEFEDAMKSGFSASTIGRWTQPLKISNPEDRRAKLINYELLKQRYKDIVLDHFGNPYTYYWQNRIKDLIQFDNDSYLQLRSYQINGTGLPVKHIRQYTKCCNVLSFLKDLSPRRAKQLGFDCMTTLYDAISTYIAAEINTDQQYLPTSYSKLRKKVKEFSRIGFKAVISGKFGNSNTQKITGDLFDWILSTYCLPTKPDTTKVHALYRSVQKKREWPSLSESGIYTFLHRHDVRPLWFLARHGETEWKREYGHTMKLFLPTYRDAMWAVDGTKLNFYYRSEESTIKMAASLKMTIVSDVFSDAIIGYSIDFTEDHVSTYQCLKNAIRFAGHKPYQIKYDNQAGFKKSETQGLMTQLSKVHFPAKPYNPQSKKVESVIGRFQKQIMSDYWFYSGQNVTAKALDSKANMDFILDNKDFLPTEEELRELFPKLIEKWNTNIQKKHQEGGKSRIERYLSSEAPDPRPVSMIDMVDSFWLERKDPITYYASGIRFKIAGKDYHFEVYESDGITPSADFHNKYIKAKFIVKYDPEDLSHIRLYDPSDKRLIAIAQNKNEYAEFVGDLTPEMRAEIDRNMQFRKDQKERSRKAAQKAQKRSGVDPQMMVEAGWRFDMKDAMNAAESAAQMAERLENRTEQEIIEDTINGL